MATTRLQDLINPEVMADMISAKIPNAIVVSPFAKIDNTLVGRAGDTITVPKYDYIGDAEDLAEGVTGETALLTADSTQATVKKVFKAVELTDEAVLSAYGNPVGETTTQLAKSIASKIDNDSIGELRKATLTYVNSTLANISYNEIVDAIDVFNEELNSEKVMFVNPKQVTSLRKDANFISADKYTGNVVMSGEIGMIANARIVPSRKVVKVEYEVGTSTDTAVTAQNQATYAGKTWDATNKAIITPEVGSYVKSVATASQYYLCPIVKLNGDVQTEDETPALTIYMKRAINLETDRVSLARKTDISVDEHYVAVLSNASKVVLAKYKA